MSSSDIRRLMDLVDSEMQQTFTKKPRPQNGQSKAVLNEGLPEILGQIARRKALDVGSIFSQNAAGKREILMLAQGYYNDWKYIKGKQNATQSNYNLYRFLQHAFKDFNAGDDEIREIWKKAGLEDKMPDELEAQTEPSDTEVDTEEDDNTEKVSGANMFSDSYEFPSIKYLIEAERTMLSDKEVLKLMYALARYWDQIDLTDNEKLKKDTKKAAKTAKADKSEKPKEKPKEKPTASKPEGKEKTQQDKQQGKDVAKPKDRDEAETDKIAERSGLSEKDVNTVFWMVKNGYVRKNDEGKAEVVPEMIKNYQKIAKKMKGDELDIYANALEKFASRDRLRNAIKKIQGAIKEIEDENAAE